MTGTARVVLLGSACDATNIVFNALRKEFPNARAIIEPRPSRAKLLLRRVRKLGLTRVAGQVLFVTGVVPLLRRSAAARIADIIRRHELDPSPIQAATHVSSVNATSTHALLREWAPQVMVVNGTRILSPETIAAAGVPIINMHLGITPAYRGVHGGYWALAEGRADLLGTTIHLIDPGIDTGPVITHAMFSHSGADNFATLPYLHLVAGIPPLLAAVSAALSGRLTTAHPQTKLKSVLRTHPTISQYVRARRRYGAR